MSKYKPGDVIKYRGDLGIIYMIDSGNVSRDEYRIYSLGRDSADRGFLHSMWFLDNQFNLVTSIFRKEEE